MLKAFQFAGNYTGLTRATCRSFWSRRGPSIFTSRNPTRSNLASLAVDRHQAPLTPPNGMPSESFGNFDLIKRVNVSYSPISVSKWRSRVTGLSVVHIDYEAPIVKGYFAVATEIFNDSGCPHTLEHLVFMGSEKYPYKGVLDNLANRAFSAGTNAWTANDSTIYTIATAGQQGFLQLLPVYVDHILYPTMTNSAFVTEVHHIDGKGEDSGVVYSEMQGRENTSGDLMALRAQRSAYSQSSAYRSETGGLMEALRVLNVETIRDYHGSYYVPHNICLIVAGKLSTEALLGVLQEQVEPSIIQHGKAHGPRPDGWKRPFLETPSVEPPVIRGMHSEVVEFPEKDESSGEMAIYFVGPPPRNQLTLKAIDLLGIYLTDTAASPLTKEFVEIPSPYCTYVAFYEDGRSTFSELAVYFGSVPSEHLDTLDERFKATIQRIIAEGLDMDRMSSVIARDRLKLMSALENSGGDVFSNTVINDFVYGDADGGDLAGSLQEYYETLKTWTSKDWTNLLSKYYDAPARLVMRGKPSASLADKIEKEEKARLAAQVERLGPDGLARLEQELTAAKEEHEKHIPEEVLTNFPVPDVKGISWISVQSAKSTPSRISKPTPQTSVSTDSSELERHIQKDTTPLTMQVQFDHVQSDFTSIHTLMSLAQLPDELRPYAVLYQMSLFNSPITRSDGTRLTHEEVINALDKDTVSYDSGLGMDGVFGELLRVSIKVESTKYDTGISWIRDVLFQSEFTKERLEVTLAKVQQSLPEMKRDGNSMSRSVFSDLVYDKTLTSKNAGVMSLMEWIPRVAAEVQDNVQSVIEKLEKVRTLITTPSAFRFSVTGNILGLPTPKASLAANFKSLPPAELQPLRWSSETLTTLGKNPSKKAVVLSLPTIESSYAVHASHAFVGFDHPDSAALRIALEVLDGTESFLWKYIRGSGLAYGANMGLNLESGLITFSLYRSPNSYKAFQEAAKVVRGLCDGSIELKQTSMDAAQSSLVYALARRVASPGKAAVTSFVNQALKGVAQNWEQDVLAQLKAVTPRQVLDVLRRYVLPIFDPSASIAVVACAPGKADDIAAGLTSEGFEVERRTLEVDAAELEDGSIEGSENEDGTSDSETGELQHAHLEVHPEIRNMTKVVGFPVITSRPISSRPRPRNRKISKLNMSEDPFSDPPNPPTILEPPARGRSTQRPTSRDKMDPEIQEIRIVDPRNKPSRSAAPANSAAPPVPPKRRSQSQDNVLQAAAAAEKARAAKSGKSSKKGGLHVDVIDRLDYSGVGPATFHHDGPFDACAPSRNRHRTKAPMLAWTPSQDNQIEETGILGAPAKETKKQSLQTTLNNMAGAGDSPYGAAASSPTTRKGKVAKDSLSPYDYPKRPSSPKRRDTLADAWGKGEPEPFEEFFAESVSAAAVGHGESGIASAASSIYKDKDGHGNPAGKSSRRTNGGVRRPTNRPPLPPPQPIFPESVPNEDEPIAAAEMTSANSGGPNRSRSLMHRIKKMRDAPNVPVGDYDEKEVTSGSSSENHNGTSRPTHKSQNSVLGRMGSGNKSPTTPGFGGDTAGGKALPGIPPPSVSPRDERSGYFDRGIGRKASIMQKVRGVVVGKSK